MNNLNVVVVCEFDAKGVESISLYIEMLNGAFSSPRTAEKKGNLFGETTSAKWLLSPNFVTL